MQDPAPSSHALDTSPEAAEMQLDAWRRMGGARRVEIAFELSEVVHGIARAGHRDRQAAESPSSG